MSACVCVCVCACACVRVYNVWNGMCVHNSGRSLLHDKLTLIFIVAVRLNTIRQVTVHRRYSATKWSVLR